MNFGNIFDNVFKAGWLDFVHAVEGEGKAELADLVGQAKTAGQAAEAAVADAAKANAALAEAYVAPKVSAALESVAGSVPVLGPLIKGEAGAAGTQATDAIIDGLVTQLQGLKTQPPAAA